jgi:hypothetical protein
MGRASRRDRSSSETCGSGPERVIDLYEEVAEGSEEVAEGSEEVGDLYEELADLSA